MLAAETALDEAETGAGGERDAKEQPLCSCQQLSLLLAFLDGLVGDPS